MKDKQLRNDADVEVASPAQGAARSPRAGEDGSTVAGAQRWSRQQGDAIGQVQMSADGGRLVVDEPEAVRATAAGGVKGGGRSLPHGDRIQAAFGRHDVSGVRAHVGGDAAQAASAVGARAYASGDQIAFADEPDLHLAAHEAAHVVQQRGDVQLRDAVGRPGDAYEAHADAVADAVVSGASAEALLDQTPGGGAASVQKFTEGTFAGEEARISETGKSATVGQSNYSQKLYATDDLIADANDKLAAAGEHGSYIRLAKTGASKKHKDHQLFLVRPVFKGQGDADNKQLEDENKGKGADETMSLWADCGRSSRVVMGSHGDAAPHAVYSVGDQEKETGAAGNPARYSDQIYLEAMTGFLQEKDAKRYLKDGVHYKGSTDSPILPSTADQARTQYIELGKEGMRAFDKYAGINTAANPEVGGGYTMNTEYGMPGFKGGRRTWNFHWAGVVMKDGSDNITLENYADGNGYDSVNMDWNYQMYGTVKEGQTFQDEHLGSGTHGSRASAFAVKPAGD